MYRSTIHLTLGIALVLFGAHAVHARGFGGSRGGGGYSAGGSRGGESRSSYSGGESRGRESGGESRGGYSSGAQRGGYSSGAERGGEHSGAEGAAAGHAATENQQPQMSGAEGAAAGHAASNRNSPQYSGAEGAAAGAAAANRHSPQYSGAQGAAAGYAASNRNSPQYSGAQGAAAGYAAGNRNTFPGGAANVTLPTDAGYGLPAAGAGAAAYAGYHQTQAVSGSVAAARGAAVRNSYNGAGMYGQAWHAANPGAWRPTAWTAGQAWGAASWPTFGAWWGWGAGTQPIAYNYGTNITYQDDEVYYGGQPTATADQYYQQASALAQGAAAPDPAAPDWMPLGVFALVQNDQSEPHYVIQLAVDKAGTLGGNYSDLVSGTTLPIHGAVDRRTQRVAWTVGNNKNTVGETGLYNLTQDEAPALIHIGNHKTQQWLLVRLKQPE
jgi:hypothetical protein